MGEWLLANVLGAAFALPGPATIPEMLPRLNDDLAAARADLEFAATWQTVVADSC